MHENSAMPCGRLRSLRVTHTMPEAQIVDANDIGGYHWRSELLYKGLYTELLFANVARIAGQLSRDSGSIETHIKDWIKMKLVNLFP